MLKKVIKYTNFAGVEKTMEAYFHLGKPEIARIAADPAFLEEMNEAAAKQDKKVMLAKIEHFVRLAYGVRSEDGERFVKNDEVQDAFIQSAAYEEFLTELLTTETGFTEFIKGVLPAKAMKELQELIAKGEAPDPFKEPTEVQHSKAVLSEQAVTEAPDDRPAWERENRKPTRREAMLMPREELLKAFQQHPSLATDLNDA